MKIDDIRALTDDGLKEELEKTHKELFNLRFQKATHQLADSTSIGKVRTDIARINTVLNERVLG